MKKKLKVILIVAFMFPCIAFSQNNIQGNKYDNAKLSTNKIVKQEFDPILDPSCKLIEPGKKNKWKAHWMWYPGQLSAHLHTQLMQASTIRCKTVGYPGRFNKAMYAAYFRKSIELKSDTVIRWAGPLGRVMLSIDGEVTSRQTKLKAGKYNLIATVDFTNSLPCLLIEGGGWSDSNGWEASLDGINWINAEFQDSLSAPDELPDFKNDIIAEILPRNIVKTNNVEVKGNEYAFKPGGSVIIDFWHDELGEISFIASGSGLLSVFVGESIEEVLNSNEALFEQWPIPPLKLTSTPTLYNLQQRCTRYIRIQANESCIVSSLKFNANIWPVTYMGSFECSDSMLNKIWKVASATVHSNMHKFYLDGIKRDGLLWGDAFFGVAAGDILFFDKNIARQSFVALLLPEHPVKEDLGVVDFPLYSLLGFEHDYMLRGDTGFINLYKNRIIELLNFYISLQDEHGFISGSNSQWGLYPDWSEIPALGPAKDGKATYFQMLLMHSFEIGYEFARLWNDKNLEALYSGKATMLRTNIQKYFWNQSEGAFINGYNKDGSIDGRFTSFAQIFGILYNLTDKEHYDQAYRTVLNNPSRRAPNLSLNYFFETLAAIKAGQTNEITKQIKNVFGRQVDQGLVRFTEDIVPDANYADRLPFYGRAYGASLCHLWAGASPVMTFSQGILGITSTAPAFKQCIINPNMCGLDWIKGSVPTPNGLLSIELDKNKGGILRIPDNIMVKLIGYKTTDGLDVINFPGKYKIIPLKK